MDIKQFWNSSNFAHMYVELPEILEIPEHNLQMQTI
jgi:hypothetical protein